MNINNILQELVKDLPSSVRAEPSEERDKIATRLMQARIDGKSNARVWRDKAYINIRMPARITIIEKDLEGMPEIIRIVYNFEPRLSRIEHQKDGLLFIYWLEHNLD